MLVSDAHPPSQALRTVSTVVIIAFLVRMVFVLLNFDSLRTSDHFERFGAEMGWTARSLALGQGFSSPFFPHTGPTALVPPLYPLLLSGIFRVFGVYTDASAFVALTLNSVFSALTSAVIYFGTRRRLGHRTAAGAAWLWALYPYSVYYSAVYLWDFALTSLLFTSCFFIATTRLPQMRGKGWAGYGILAGLAILSNPCVLPLVAFLILFAAWQRWRIRGKVAQRLLLAGVCMSAVVSPWVLRNVRVFHEPMLRDGFWGEFYAGNNGDTSHSNPGWTHPASSSTQMLRYQQLGESGYMAEKRTLALHHVQANPSQFVAVTLRRIVRYWTGYWSFSRHYLTDEELDVPNVPFCTLLTGLMLISLWQGWRRSRLATIPYAVAFLVLPLPYYITHSSIDYRQPIEPLLAVSVVGGVRWLWERQWNSAAARDFIPLSETA